jgi:predicted AAA+ superfamily ATPase
VYRHTKYVRWQSDTINLALKSRRVVVLAGSRQSGKTTLTKDLAQFAPIYRTLDDITLLDAALSDPHGFVHHGDELMIIDEIQKALILLPAIKKEGDENTKMGRFLLTGSANIQSHPGVNESLAGRVRKIRLRPLAQGEIHGVLPNFLAWAYLQKFPKKYESCSKDCCIKLGLNGGYPEPFFMETLSDAQQWHRDYIDAMIERDLKDIINIKRQTGMKEFLAALAARSSKAMDLSAIASGLSLTRQTIVAYITALETLYLVEKLPAWSKTDYARVAKTDKIFITDSGLMAALLNWDFEKIQFDTDKNQKLIETFVFNQLSAHLDALAGRGEMYTMYTQSS